MVFEQARDEIYENRPLTDEQSVLQLVPKIGEMVLCNEVQEAWATDERSEELLALYAKPPGFELPEDIGQLPIYERQEKKRHNGKDKAESGVVTSALRQYEIEIGKYSLLERADEVRLAKYIEVGKTASTYLETHSEELTEPQRNYLRETIQQGWLAKEDFARANLRLVAKIAYKYRPAADDQMKLDTIQEGNIGLQTAVEKFEWRRGFKFSTYASWWIKQSITKGDNQNEGAIRVPVNVKSMIRRLDNIEQEFVITHGEMPDSEVVADELNVKPEVIDELRRTRNNMKTMSLDAPMTGGDMSDLDFDSTSWAFDLANESRSLDPAYHAIEKDSSRITEEVLATELDEDEQRVICLKLGIGQEAQKQIRIITQKTKEENRDGLTDGEIAKEMGKKSDEIKWIYYRALERLKDNSAAILRLNRLRDNESLNEAEYQ